MSNSQIIDAWRECNAAIDTIMENMLIEKLNNNTPWENIKTESVPGHTRYLHGIDLPIYVNSVCDENDEFHPSEVAEMHIGEVNGKKAIIITPIEISMS